MSAGGIVILVPMKPLRVAKSRLAPTLSAPQRVALSVNLLQRVLEAALESRVSRVWVVGGDRTVSRMAAGSGAEWLDDGGAGLNDALWAAFQRAHRQELAPLYLPADLPFVTRSDVNSVVEVSGGGETLTLAPAKRDGGTNAILSPLGSPFRTALGADSFRRHMEQADELGVPVAVCDRPGIGFDLDTPADMSAYEEMEPGLLRRLTASARPRPMDVENV